MIYHFSFPEPSFFLAAEPPGGRQGTRHHADGTAVERTRSRALHDTFGGCLPQLADRIAAPGKCETLNAVLAFGRARLFAFAQSLVRGAKRKCATNGVPTNCQQNAVFDGLQWFLVAWSVST